MLKKLFSTHKDNYKQLIIYVEEKRKVIQNWLFNVYYFTQFPFHYFLNLKVCTSARLCLG